MSAMISAPGYPGAELRTSQPMQHTDRSSRIQSLIRWFIGCDCEQESGQSMDSCGSGKSDSGSLAHQDCARV